MAAQTGDSGHLAANAPGGMHGGAAGGMGGSGTGAPGAGVAGLDGSRAGASAEGGRGAAGASGIAGVGANASMDGGTQAGTGGTGAIAAAGSGGQAGTGGTGAIAGTGGSSSTDFVVEPNDDATYVFDQSQVRTYNIVIADSDLAQIDAHPAAEQWVPAELEFEGTIYSPIKIRYKGGGGSFKAPCTSAGLDDPKAGKCSVKLGFDEVDPDLRFYGLKKLNLHSMNHDPSLLRDRLGYSLYRDSNVAAPRSIHARVLINGQLEGLFVAVEQIDGRFTRARFAEGGKGNVYKESWPAYDDQAKFEASLETNSDAPNVQHMLEFEAAVQNGAAASARLVDRSYLMRFAAVDRVIINDDGSFHFYCDVNNANAPGHNHNYYWYEASSGQRFWIVPWDLDFAFDQTPSTRINPAWDVAAECTCTKPDGFESRMPALCDPLVQVLAAWRDDYEREVDRFLAGPFASSKVDAKLNAWSTQIRPFVIEAAGTNQAPDESTWDSEVQWLRSQIDSARSHRGLAY